MSDDKSLFQNLQVPAEASKDPIRIMIEIAEHETLEPEYKKALIQYAQTRFRNRRKMAYLALWAILGSLLLLFIAAFVDGIRDAGPGEGIMDVIVEGENIIIWVEGFLTTIVAAYYGVSAWRPSS